MGNYSDNKSREKATHILIQKLQEGRLSGEKYGYISIKDVREHFKNLK